LSGIRDFANFSLSYRGFIQHRVRQQLDRLTPDDVGKFLKEKPVDSAKHVRFWLESMYDASVGSINMAFTEWVQEPNQVAFAIVEELIDAVIRAQGAMQEWRDFYAEERGTIWQKQFDLISGNTALRQQWNQAVSTVENTSQLPLFSFAERPEKGA
jgi:hypothetical protein